MMKRYPDHPVWQVTLQQTGRRENNGRVIGEVLYDENSFDWLFVVTPGGDYLIEWKNLCQELVRIPNHLVLGKNMDKYRIS